MPPRRAKIVRKLGGPAEVRRRDERDARVARILDAALEIAVDEGLEAVTTTRLAAKLGYTVGAFYRYWESIDALLAALHRRTAELFYDAFFRALASARGRLDADAKRRSPRVRALAEVVLLTHLYRRIASEHPRHFELVSQILIRRWTWIDEGTQARLDALVLPRVQEIVGILARAAEEGAIERGDPLLRTFSIWVGVHGPLAIAPLEERHRGLVDREAILEGMVRSLLLGWGAGPADLAAAGELAAAAVDDVAR